LQILPQGNKFLNLYQRFEGFWKQLEWTKAQKFLYFIGPSAGFTDTRIIHIWLKSLVYFYPQKIYQTETLAKPLKSSADLAVKFLLTKMAKLQQEPTTSLRYSKQPSIGGSSQLPYLTQK